MRRASASRGDLLEECLGIIDPGSDSVRRRY
jgi:hypothetical protein